VSRKASEARTARSRMRAATSAAAALAATAALAAPAGAAVNGSHVVAVLPATQGLELSGYPVNDALNVHVKRNGVTIGSATGTTTPDKKDPNNGVLNVAGGAPPCWTGSTPQILPGDEVTVDDGGAGVDSMIVQNVAATSLERDPGTGDILVHGFAIAPNGGEFDPTTFANSVQARITISATGTPFSNGRNSVRAGGGKFDGTVSYDPPTLNDPNPTTWTADFPMTDLDAQLALGNKNFEGVFLVGLSELTIGRTPAGASGCPAPAADAVTSFDPSVLNVSNVGSPLTVRGVAEPGATNVSVVVSDTKGNKVTDPHATLSGGSFTTAPLDVHGLVDGTLTATPTFTVANQPDFVGATLTMAKDVLAPPAPISKTSPGTLPGTKSVTLADDDPTAAIHFTVAGNAPLPDSPLYVSPITITDTTTIRAIAVDRAGNEGPAATFTVTFPDAVGGSGPSSTGSTPSSAGSTTIVQQVPFLLPLAPAQAVQAVTATSLPSVGGLSVAVLRGHALRLVMRLGRGAGVVRLRVFRTRHGRAVGSPVLSTLRLPSAAGVYTVTLRAHALRALRPGRYVAEARAGASPGLYGAPARAAFTVQ
jgi:chitobiase/beta-hexosaminidase-like protein